MRNDIWAESREVQLVAMWNSGMSALQIGNLMGLSRNAVMGKVFRLRNDKGLELQKRTIGRKRSTKVKRERAQYRGIKIARRKRRLIASGLVPEYIPGPGVPFLIREAGQCAYITSPENAKHPDVMCCGNGTIDSSSWCVFHRSLVYRPTTKADLKRFDIARIAA